MHHHHISAVGRNIPVISIVLGMIYVWKCEFEQKIGNPALTIYGSLATSLSAYDKQIKYVVVYSLKQTQLYSQKLFSHFLCV